MTYTLTELLLLIIALNTVPENNPVLSAVIMVIFIIHIRGAYVAKMRAKSNLSSPK